MKEIEDYKSDIMAYEKCIREFETKEKVWTEEAEKLKEVKFILKLNLHLNLSSRCLKFSI